MIYTESDIQFIKDNLQSLTHQEIADALGRSRSSIKEKCRELGLVKTEYIRHKVTDRNYTPGDIDFLKTNIDVMSWQNIADALGRTKASVIDKAKKLGFVKNPINQYKHRKNIWSDPSIAMAKTNMALKSKLEIEEIPDQLAELHALRLKMNYHLTNNICK